MECDDAAVERQKLVSNDEEDDQATITNLSSSGQAKSIQTPISPVLSNKIFSSGETSRSRNSTSYPASLGKPVQGDAPPSAKLNYVNERRSHDTKTKPKKVQREVPDVRHMERALLGLLEDFHSGKLKAFGSGCTMEQMTSIREQQESLAKLHFDLGNESSFGSKGGNEVQSQNNMKQLVAKLEQLSFSIEKLHSSNVEH
ncbi:coiled-coil domain-containing protein 28A isoform X2 [Toxorhynchites rutilus septentrionalis]|uniref:coiled-coil domain-containing protein 28A isoform X2 n=1 Tax=Toxorhynchites rutilus septentrionalis TaxID=329112 RepID=UPI0024788F7A|nr:coiled-coil domain-containing protein 28A isoform X2 [Toxorhynchites rutilus septentrionalis]